MSKQHLYPSTEKYKERTTLRRDDPYEYGNLYNATQGSDVWTRLMSDACVRQSKSAAVTPCMEGGNAFFDNGSLSGFISNTPKATYTHNSFKQGYNPPEGPPLDSLHPITLRNYKKKYPMDYMAAVRPETETCNQTLRMLGTYPTDQANADRMGAFIPSGCPGGQGWYHPDVKFKSYV